MIIGIAAWTQVDRQQDVDQLVVNQLNRSDYDVIVVGGDPEGVMAAVASARKGARTLLIESRDGLGATMTYGMLNYLDLSFLNDQNINAGLFKEWHDLVGGTSIFEPDRAKAAFLQLVKQEPNLTLALNTKVREPLFEAGSKRLIGLVAENDQGEHRLSAKRIIDCTQDADFAAMSGVPYFVGMEDIGIRTEMSVTLMIHLKDVDWNGVHRAVEQKKFGGGFINKNAAWGFWELKDAYQPREKGARLRGLNIALNEDGTIYINALQLMGVDGLDLKAKQEATEAGKRETGHILSFMQKEFPGFERAQIASFPEELYVRETRHIEAEYQLQVSDLWENKDQWDSIGFGGYPLDIQATAFHRDDAVLGAPRLYAIPFRSLVPLAVDNLLVASRASGYSSLAASSARVIPTGMTAGQAAGVAAVLSIEDEISFREMSRDRERMFELQEELRKQGAALYAFQMKYPYQGEWFYPAVKSLLSFGLIAGGYENNLHAEETMNETDALRLFERSVRILEPGRKQEVEANLEPLKKSVRQRSITRDKLLEIALATQGERTSGRSLQTAKDKGLIDPIFAEKVRNNRELNRAEIYHFLAHLYRDQLSK
ncbi:FAD-dependent oxidoreductase [Tumebacillus lipolyticus]|uniref:FAD-dependent oxidoreductase n=1 Tax=Tumebacillus lipolyticus TaxID=1280370 RepID=A0ABW4ZWB1_9BACL